MKLSHLSLSLALLVLTQGIYGADRDPYCHWFGRFSPPSPNHIQLMSPAIYTVEEVQKMVEYTISLASLKAMLKRDPKPSDQLAYVYVTTSDSGWRKFIPLEIAQQGKEGQSIELNVYGIKDVKFICHHFYHQSKHSESWEVALKKEVEAYAKRQEALEFQRKVLASFEKNATKLTRSASAGKLATLKACEKKEEKKS